MLTNNLSDSNSIEIVNLKKPWHLWFYRCIFKKRVNVSRFITIKLLTPTLSLHFRRGLYIYVYIYTYIIYIHISYIYISYLSRIMSYHVLIFPLFSFRQGDVSVSGTTESSGEDSWSFAATCGRGALEHVGLAITCWWWFIDRYYTIYINYIHIYIYMYIHTYIHTYLPTYIHTYIHEQGPPHPPLPSQMVPPPCGRGGGFSQQPSRLLYRVYVWCIYI